MVRKYCIRDVSHDVDDEVDESCPVCCADVVEISDELEVFHELAKQRWYTGRAKYQRLGRKFYNEDSIREAQQEVLDLSNYAMKIYWDLEDLKTSIDSINRCVVERIDNVR